MRAPTKWMAVTLSTGAVVCMSILQAQPSPTARPAGSWQSELPELHARLAGIERAQGVLFGALLAGHGKVEEPALLRRLLSRLGGGPAGTGPDGEAEEGFAGLGAREAEVLRRAHEFHRDVVAAFAVSRTREERRSALDTALRRYRAHPDDSVPDAPKDMTILYDHPYTSFVPPAPPEREPRRVLPYPSLTGSMWSAHWYKLAVLEPLEFFSDPAERARGLATVSERFARKLTGGTPPDGFPTELPLTPAIAPGLALIHEGAAATLDNINLMLEVIADVLAHPAVPDRRAAVAEVVAQFTEREYRCVQNSEWMLVALRHSIFAQGGPALATMAKYERNAFSGNHGQHYGPRRAPACDPE